MDPSILKHLFRNINTLPVKTVLRKLSTSYQGSLNQQRVISSTSPFLSLSCERTKNLPTNVDLRLYNTSVILRQQDGEKLERPDEMNRTRQKFDPSDAGKGGPVTWRNLLATGGVVAVLMGAYYYTKAQKDAIRDADRKREIGKSKIGGGFDLIDHQGKPKTSADYYGKWVLLYFGFTHCPDICPDEMEKMAAVYDQLKEAREKNKNVGEVVPLMISVDPERDGVPQMAEYVKEFHPELVGLTGSVEKIMQACKAFRVYFSAGPRDDEDDYIVDHTIIIYLLDPEGQFVDYYGQTKDVKQIVTSVQVQMAKYESSAAKSLYSLSK